VKTEKETVKEMVKETAKFRTSAEQESGRSNMRKYESDDRRISLARELAAEAIVLLKNEERCLPLTEKKKIALLGRTQNAAVIGGGGSGASFSENALQAAEEFRKAGLLLEPGMEAFYQEIAIREKAAGEDRPDLENMDLQGLVNSGIIYEIFGKYNCPQEEPMPEEKLWEDAAAWTDTAVCIIGRAAGGEECDRRVTDDYYLLASETELVRKAAGNFAKVIVVLNVNGPVDTDWVSQFPQIQAVLLEGACGEQGMGALADILTGKVTPSGKLAQTLAKSYEDYPSAGHFSYNKEAEDSILTYGSYGLSAEENGSRGFGKSPVTVYREGIYVGYRYFDSFRKEVMYPFGYGLSYGEFSWECIGAEIKDGRLAVRAVVENESAEYKGKEVLQMYVHAPCGFLEHPYQELKAAEKTRLLQPGEKQEIVLAVELQELASFDEGRNAWILEKGAYSILLGTSSQDTVCIADLTAEEETLVRRLSADIGLHPANRGKLDFLRQETPRSVEKGGNILRLQIRASDFRSRQPSYKGYDFSVPAKKSTLQDVCEGRVSMEMFLNQMTAEELAVLCNGFGPGLPFGGLGKEAPVTIQYEDGTDIAYGSNKNAFPGYMNPALKKYGIYSACYKDGPASVGKTAWPTGMMLSCTFNKELLYEFGSACGYEAEMQGADSWLAPGMNIVRNPIGGRVFEYFSEDPFWTGVCGIQIAKGAMENNEVTVCPKHFALNEQETYRRGSERKNYDAVDSIAEARAVREIYLKPFEMVITEAKPRTVMTSFNKINGVFAGGNKTLCTEILREEWGYEGVVVTDWGDMDAVVDGADAVAAGNDVVMPGGPPVIRQVLEGYKENRVTLDEMKEAAAHLMNFVMHSKSYKEQQAMHK